MKPPDLITAAYGEESPDDARAYRFVRSYRQYMCVSAARNRVVDVIIHALCRSRPIQALHPSGGQARRKSALAKEYRQ